MNIFDYFRYKIKEYRKKQMDELKKRESRISKFHDDMRKFDDHMCKFDDHMRRSDDDILKIEKQIEELKIREKVAVTINEKTNIDPADQRDFISEIDKDMNPMVDRVSWNPENIADLIEKVGAEKVIEELSIFDKNGMHQWESCKIVLMIRGIEDLYFVEASQGYFTLIEENGKSLTAYAEQAKFGEEITYEMIGPYEKSTYRFGLEEMNSPAYLAYRQELAVCMTCRMYERSPESVGKMLYNFSHMRDTKELVKWKEEMKARKDCITGLKLEL